MEPAPKDASKKRPRSQLPKEEKKSAGPAEAGANKLAVPEQDYDPEYPRVPVEPCVVKKSLMRLRRSDLPS